MMKRVLLVTSFFRPEPGGLEALFTGIARRWDPESLYVLVTSAPDTHLRDATDRYRFDKGAGFTVDRFAPRRDLMGTDMVFQDRVREILNRFVPDHILFGDLSRVSRLVLRAAGRTPPPYSVFLNGADLKNSLGFFRWGERRFVLGARNVFALSHFLARGAIGYGISEDRLAVVPPGMELSARPARSSQLPKEWTQRTRGRIVIAATGPFLPRKGLDVAVEALAILPPAVREKAHLLLIGSGPDFTFVEELVRIRKLESAVTMTGFVSDDWYHALLKRADLFVQPGREREDDSAGLGTAVMEAAFHGLPAVVGNLGGLTERVRDGVSGFVVEAGNPQAVAARLRELIEVPRELSRLGRNAIEIARREYDLKRSLAAVETRL